MEEAVAGVAEAALVAVAEAALVAEAAGGSAPGRWGRGPAGALATCAQTEAIRAAAAMAEEALRAGETAKAAGLV